MKFPFPTKNVRPDTSDILVSGGEACAGKIGANSEILPSEIELVDTAEILRDDLGHCLWF